MAQATVLLRLGVELADVDRGVYETLDLRVAQHPSESLARVVIRCLARCLLHEEGLEFGRGLSNVDEPALALPGSALMAFCPPGMSAAAPNPRTSVNR